MAARCQVCASSDYRTFIDGEMMGGSNPHKIFSVLPPESGISLSSLYRHARANHHDGGSLLDTTPDGEAQIDHLRRVLDKVANLEAMATAARKRANAALAIRADSEVAKISMSLLSAGFNAELMDQLEVDRAVRQAIARVAYADPELAATFVEPLAAVDPAVAADWSKLVDVARKASKSRTGHKKSLAPTGRVYDVRTNT